ncbi:helix-turn-helix domain-containing protein [Nocardia sp. NPDC059246]|uniref:helix-turn-helix domain-containing protein n=1 Tax=unclassified Nocardia TaxID=2637762 RepID=UPI00367A5B33
MEGYLGGEWGMRRDMARKAGRSGGSRRNRQYPPMDRIEDPGGLKQHLMDALDATARHGGVTRADFAQALGQTEASVTKYFRMERQPTPDALDTMCDVLGMPKMFALNIGHALMPRLFAAQTGAFPPIWAAGDLEHLEAISHPAAYLQGPQLNPMATNAAWKQHFSWMREPTDEVRPNLIVEILTNEGAAHTFGDSWPKVCAWAVQYLILFGAHVVPQEEVGQIFKLCQENPDFGTYVTTIPDAQAITEPTVVTILGPDNLRRRHVIKVLGQKWQHPDAWDLILFTPIE